jgi:hypothetical protein
VRLNRTGCHHQPIQVRRVGVGGLDIHRKQLTFDYPGIVTREVRRGQIAPADRAHLRLAGAVRWPR